MTVVVSLPLTRLLSRSAAARAVVCDGRLGRAPISPGIPVTSELGDGGPFRAQGPGTLQSPNPDIILPCGVVVPPPAPLRCTEGPSQQVLQRYGWVRPLPGCGLAALNRDIRHFHTPPQGGAGSDPDATVPPPAVLLVLVVVASNQPLLYEVPYSTW